MEKARLSCGREGRIYKRHEWIIKNIKTQLVCPAVISTPQVYMDFKKQLVGSALYGLFKHFISARPAAILGEAAY